MILECLRRASANQWLFVVQLVRAVDAFSKVSPMQKKYELESHLRLVFFLFIRFPRHLRLTAQMTYDKTATKIKIKVVLFFIIVIIFQYYCKRYLTNVLPDGRVWHKAFFRWFRAQGRNPDTPGGSKNATDTVGIPKKRGTSGARR